MSGRILGTGDEDGFDDPDLARGYGTNAAYGQSKLAGEIALRDSGAVHLLMRISWIYSEHGKNFPLSILNLAKSRDALNVVADEVGAATSSLLVAQATIVALRQAIADGRLRPAAVTLRPIR